MIDRTTLDTWSDDELEQAKEAINQEKQRRYTLKTAERQMDRLEWDYSEASGRVFGGEWTQPVGGHDAYPKNYRVTHGGKEWVSLFTANVWEPGTSGWREYVDPGSGVVPDFLPPTGAHDAYSAGERATYHGKVYESTIDANVYSPEEYPEGWKEVVEDSAETPVEGPQEWVAPTGAHDAYNTGDQVLFEGQTYESVIDANTYSPASYPAGWILVSAEVTPGPEVPAEPDPEPEPDAPAEEAVPEFAQPSGAHDAYQVGDQVLFEGAVYESVIENNVYSPVSYPAGWKAV